MIDLKQLATDLRLRVTLDESARDEPRSERPWLWQIPGRFGHVYVQGENMLAVYATGNKIRRDRIVAAGATIRQDGDREFSATFLPDRLREICDIIHARKKRVMTPEQRAQSALRLAAYGFQPGHTTGSQESRTSGEDFGPNSCPDDFDDDLDLDDPDEPEEIPEWPRG